ncbi:MAG TPA: hypothetical protein VJM50_15715 [Pyrinomonadaceae bacterium]|nr:hypothetical protein [Pyrinomonadaceae bacterium]
MACGSCGGKRQNVEYEVTYRDGSTDTFDSLQKVRIAMAKDTSTGRPSPSYRMVQKKS